VAATIATHDLGLLPGSYVEYTAWEPNALMITPLGRTAQCSARSLYDKLQNEAEALKKEKKRTTYSGIHKFLYLLQGKQLWPCLRNSEEEVISFPPITNSDISKISPETTDIFIEVTSSSSQPVCKKVMDDLLVAMLDLGLGEASNGQKTLTVQQVRIVNPEGNMKCVYPSKVDLNIHDKPNFKVIR
jgi:phenylalanyl-tRNA synthetase beta subunit